MHLRRDAGIWVVAALTISLGVPEVAVAQTPADSYYNFLLGRHLESDGNAAGALAALDKAAAADPKSAEIRAEIASLQLRRNPPMREEAEKAAKAALALDPANTEANSVLGRLYASAAANEKNTRAQTETYVRDAIQHLERATVGVQGPPDPTLNYTLGRMYTVAGQTQKGIEALERTVSQSPYSVQARLALAQAHAANNDFAAAVETLDAVADDSPVALEEMAKYQMGAGQYKDAISTYTRGLEGQPNNRRLKVQRIIAAYEDEQYQQAATFAADAQRQHQDDPNFPRLQASALMKAGSTPRAIELLESSARTFPRDGEINFMLASLYRDTGRNADAERSLRQMLTIDPTNHRVLNYLGYMLAEDGRDLDEAIKLVQSALKAEPGRGEYLDSLGWAHFQRGNLAEAEKYLTEAARKLPDHPEILDHLGDLYARQNRWQDAITAWTRALEGGEGVEPAPLRKKIDDARGRVAK